MDRREIRALVEAFYAEVRRHPRLGPIFEGRIGVTAEDWAPHLDKIEAFWASTLLGQRGYSGRPMQAHAAVEEIEDGDFDLWLDLFERTAQAVLGKERAAQVDLVARRIGASLRMGLDRARTPGSPPNLRT